MSELHPTPPDNDVSPSRRAQTSAEVIVASAFAAFGGYMIVEALTRLKLWSASGPGSGFLPLVAGVLLVAAGLFVVATRLRRRSPLADESEQEPSQKHGGRLVLVTMVAIAGAIALVPVIGLVGAIFLAQVVILRFGDRHRWLVALLFPIATCALVFVVFELVFLISLPGGLIY